MKQQNGILQGKLLKLKVNQDPSTPVTKLQDQVKYKHTTALHVHIATNFLSVG